MKQYLTKNINDFLINKQSLLQSLKFNIMGNNINPLPVIINKDILHFSNEINIVLIKIIKKIIADFTYSKEIQNCFNFDNKILNIIKIINEKPYDIGIIRPDIIIDENNKPKICEINARFAFNGLVSSSYLEEYFNHINSHSVSKEILNNALKVFNINKPITILKDKENGNDINLIYKELIACGYDIKILSHKSLTLKNGVLYSGNEKCSQYILELHQEEILNIPENILEKLAKDCTTINDLRTILIVHDKRFLSLLTNESFLLKYLDNKEVSTLKKHIIPTYNLSNTPISNFLSEKNSWVFKLNLSGKGDGMFFGKDFEKDVLSKKIYSLQHQYIAQPLIKQKYFKILTLHNENLEYIDKNIILMLYCSSQKLKSFGFIRAGTTSIINLSTHNSEIIPVMN